MVSQDEQKEVYRGRLQMYKADMLTFAVAAGPD